MSTIANLSSGTFETFGMNELMLKSSVDDPPKFRQSSPGPGRSLGCFSWERNGAEKVLVQGKLSDDGQSGEFTIHVDNGQGGDAGMIEIFRADKDGVHTFGAPITGGSAFMSPNGRYRTQFQDDGNVVTYDVSVTPWKAKWSTLTGWIG